jgi:hypothetical protein
MTIGVAQIMDPKEQWLDQTLMQPFRAPAQTYAIRRRDDRADEERAR